MDYYIYSFTVGCPFFTIHSIHKERSILTLDVNLQLTTVATCVRVESWLLGLIMMQVTLGNILHVTITIIIFSKNAVCQYNSNQDFIHPQFGFAHRVNTATNIKAVLKAGVNGIEIDICWGKGIPDDDKYDWFVSYHDFNVCHSIEASTLTI